MEVEDQDASHESDSATIRTMQTGCHVWLLQNYSLHKGLGLKKPITSDVFILAGHCWMIDLFPGGNTVDANNAGDVSIFISYAGTVPVVMLFELYLMDQSGRGNHKGLPFGNISRQIKCGQMLGRNHFVSRGVLESPDYLKDDCLRISCKIRVLTRHVRNMHVVGVPESDIGADFGRMLESEEGADVLFKVGDERIWGHKWILVLTSPVFRSRLSDCRLRLDEEIVIPDMEPRIFKAMLRFIYTGTLEEDEQTSGSYSGSSMMNSFLGKMLSAADQFELKKLKTLCESRLLEKLSGESVAYLLHLADLYHAKELKAACLRFAAENHVAVLESDGCEYLKETCPSLFLELAYKKPSSSPGQGFCIKLLSAVKEPFVGLFSFQGASDMKHYKRIKDT